MRRWFVLRRGEQPPVPVNEPLTRRTVIALGILLLLPATALRAWMLYPSWFYADDLRLLAEASRSPFTWHHLATPYDNQFMPGGRAVVWLVAHSGDLPASWSAAATVTLVMWVLSGLACLWMLLELFGPRWGVLGLLALHATTALTAPATMWWAASLNQLPLLVVWYSSVAAWMHYLRRRSWPWLVTTLLLLGVGALFYVKTLVVLPVLLVLLLGWFATGSPLARMKSAIRAYWPAAVVLAAATLGFAWFYRVRVPQPFTEEPTGELAWSLAQTMAGRTFVPAALGGPWEWAAPNPPVAVVDTPNLVLVVLWWVVAIALVALLVLCRRVGGILVIVLGLATAFALLLTTRAPVLGAVVGREPRYLTETICALVVGVGLATMPVPGSRASSAGFARLRPGPAVPLLLTLVVSVSGALSSIAYARVWHDSNPVDTYLHRFALDASLAGRVDVADTEMPSNMSLYVHPFNTLAVLAPLVTDTASFPEVTDRLMVPDEHGEINLAAIDPSGHGVDGPTPDCGWNVGARGVTIPLERPVVAFDWWVRVPYRASASTPVTVTVGNARHSTTLQPGLGSVYVHHGGTFEDVRIDGIQSDVSVCIGRVDVGRPVPGGAIDAG